MKLKKVLVICVHNSARSQMAEEYLRRYGGDIFDVESAGLEPGVINPMVAALLLEDGIDISGKKTRSVFDLHASGRSFDYVIAVCDSEAKERCPIFPAEKGRLHWPFADPAVVEGTADERLAAIRPIRDAIKKRVIEFVAHFRETGRAE